MYLVILMLGTIAITSCSSIRPVNVHVLNDHDIFAMPEGTKVVFSDGTEKTTKVDGWYHSKHFSDKVMRYKLKKLK